MIYTVAWGRREYRVRVIDYTINPGSPALAPAYSHGGVPGEPAFVEDVRLDNASHDEPLPFDFDDLDEYDRRYIEQSILDEVR